MSNAQEAAPAPAKGRRMNKIVLILVCLLCTAAGAAVPWVAYGSSKGSKDEAGKDAHGGDGHGSAGHGASGGHAESKDHKGHGAKFDVVPFGDVVVNLHEERMTRYLRVKIVLTVDAGKEKAVTEHMNNSKAQLKNWLISHLCSKTLKDVGGSVGVKRLQREILEHFETVLYPEGDGPLREVLFEEYAVQ